MPVARVARIGQQPVLARIHQQGAGQQQRARASRGDHDALRVDVQAVTLLIEAGNGLAQLGNAPRRGVTGFPRRQCRLAGLDDRLGRGEVRFADFQVNDVMAGRLQLIGARQQCHDVERFDSAAARTVGLGH
ncbi:hypothetical protein D3C85_915670 [compost metagenome]